MNGWSSVSSSSGLRRDKATLRNGMTVMGALSLVTTLVLAGCGPQGMSTTTKGTLGGGVLGGGTGAIVGAAVGHPLAGAAIGGALGAGTGYVVGNSLQSQEVSSQQQGNRIEYQQREIQSQRRQIQQLQQEQQTE
jgi:osmotically inducible lipoprotein OsmB